MIGGVVNKGEANGVLVVAVLVDVVGSYDVITSYDVIG